MSRIGVSTALTLAVTLTTATLTVASLTGASAANAAPDHARSRPPACQNHDLVASYRYSDSGAGHFWGWIVLRNRSQHRCATGGYGGISYVGHGDGTQIGAAATRDGGRVREYVVRPGQRLLSPLQETDAQVYSRHQCRPVRVDGFRVYVPNATRSQYVPHRTIGCANPRVHLLSHRAYRR